MKSVYSLWVLSIFFICASPLNAGIVFDLRDDGIEDVDEVSTIMLTSSGLTGTLTANQGVFNGTGSGFGINSPNNDDTDRFDGVDGAESFSVSFNQAVTFNTLQLSDFAVSEIATITINGFTSVSLSATTSGDDIYNFTEDNTVAAGETVVIAWNSGNGFSVDNFMVTATAVPEPTTFAMFGIPLGVLLFRRRRGRAILHIQKEKPAI